MFRSLNSALAIGLAAVLLAGCSSPQVPDSSFDGNIVSVQHLKSLYRGMPVRLGEERSIRGVVVSSDSCGNFYKELVIQDATGGISVRADAGKLYTLYPQGTTVIVRCNNLTLGSYGGRIELGVGSADPDYETGRIPSEQLPLTVVRSRTQLPVPEPAEVALANLQTLHIGTSVRLSPILKAVDAVLPGTTWAGNRIFRAAPYTAGADSILIRTAEKATFANERLPAGPVRLSGIVSWWNGAYQLIIVRPDKIGIFTD